MNYWLGAGLIAAFAAILQVACARRVLHLAGRGGSLRELRGFQLAAQFIPLLPCLGPLLMVIGWLTDPRFTPVTDGAVGGLLLAAWPSLVFIGVILVASPIGDRIAPTPAPPPTGSLPMSHLRIVISHTVLHQTGLNLIVVGFVTPGPLVAVGILALYGPLVFAWLQRRQVQANRPLQPTGIEATLLHRDLVMVMRQLGWKGDELPLSNWPFGTREERDQPGFAHSVLGQWVNGFRAPRPIFYSEVIRMMPADALTALTASLMVSSVNGVRPAWQGWKVRLIALVAACLGLGVGFLVCFVLAEILDQRIGFTGHVILVAGGPWVVLGLTLLVTYRLTALLGVHSRGAGRYHDSFEAWRSAGCGESASEFVRAIFRFNLAANPHPGALEAVRALLLGYRPLTDFMLQAGLEPAAWYDSHRAALAEDLAAMLPPSKSKGLQDHLTASMGTGIDC